MSVSNIEKASLTRAEVSKVGPDFDLDCPVCHLGFSRADNKCVLFCGDDGGEVKGMQSSEIFTVVHQRCCVEALKLGGPTAVPKNAVLLDCHFIDGMGPFIHGDRCTICDVAIKEGDRTVHFVGYNGGPDRHGEGDIYHYVHEKCCIRTLRLA
jgi:hypothetical protein